MKHSIKVGFSFGLTSAVITTLGLMIGLYSSLGTKLAVIGGVLTIAIADAFSDALGIHISEESEGIHTSYEVWQSTLSTFLSKFLFALTFLVPILLLELKIAVYVSIVWGLLILSTYSIYLSKKNKHMKIWEVVTEHLVIAILVIITTYYVGKLISIYFT